jgi:MFS family permease
MLGLVCMAADLVLCALAPYFFLLLATFALGGFGNGLALVHDRLLLSHAVPDALHGRLFALHKAFTSAAFALSFITAGVLISTFGVRTMFLSAGLSLLIMIVLVHPHLRQQWPEPTEGQEPASLQPRPSAA